MGQYTRTRLEEAFNSLFCRCAQGTHQQEESRRSKESAQGAFQMMDFMKVENTNQPDVGTPSWFTVMRQGASDAVTITEFLLDEYGTLVAAFNEMAANTSGHLNRRSWEAGLKKLGYLGDGCGTV